MQQRGFIDNIIKICNKRPSERLPNDITLLTELTKNCKVFKNLVESSGSAIHYQCCKYIKYEFCNQNEYLFRFGDIGTRFYIILSGVVAVEVQRKKRNGEIFYIEITQLDDGSSFGELALESKKKGRLP